MAYVGRFAPSPTGPLHVGSLTAALASYLHARQARGRWLVRIEDIDPPREAPGAADRILATLEAFDLQWDGTVHYQSARVSSHRSVAASLLADGRAFRCSCTRSELRGTTEVAELGTRYPGHCRTRAVHDRATAVRMRVEPGEVRFVDRLQGEQRHDLSTLTGDYVIVRKDGLPAYHLAAVLDDAGAGITHIVRGIDLLRATTVHLHLQRTLQLPTPVYLHVPVVVNDAGQKLSKQTGAAAVEDRSAAAVAVSLLGYLGLSPPTDLIGAAPRALWAWAIERWDPDVLAGKTRLADRRHMVGGSEID